MTDFLLELRSEEIPARMQAKARDDLARLFAAELAQSGITAAETISYATPRRLALILRGLPQATQAVREELKGPRSSAPPQALEGFLRKTGLAREQLEERDGVFFAVIERPGRATAEVLASAIPAVIRAFAWPKSMRWGAASRSTESQRWVRPLHGIVALFGGDIVPVTVSGVESGAATLGHRFHHPGAITIGSAGDYVEKLRAAHVIVDQDERMAIIRTRASALAREAGLELIEDEGLVAENAGLTEWPVPLLGRFDAAFLEVPPEAIQLTARVNQKYFVCRDGAGKLANAFVCTANIAATDGGAKIVEGNRKVLAARLADARFFYETDLKVPLAEQAKKLEKIVFHEKLGTVADKVERVAKLARWLVEEGLEKAKLADMAERAARLAKADLVTGMVGEFPELQGLMGGYYATAQGEPREVAEAIRDHYKPVGQGDEVPTAPVTVAVSLADKLDTIAGFFSENERPTGSKDPFALRRAALGVLAIIQSNGLRFDLRAAFVEATFRQPFGKQIDPTIVANRTFGDLSRVIGMGKDVAVEFYRAIRADAEEQVIEKAKQDTENLYRISDDGMLFFADRLKVQQREAGVRHDLIDAVFALGGEDDLVRLLARVHALQSFVTTDDGANLLAGYKRAANILKKEGYAAPATAVTPAKAGGQTPDAGAGVAASASLDSRLRGNDEVGAGYTPEPAEAALEAALDAAEPAAADAVANEDFEAAMAALATLRAPIDVFFDAVTVNDADQVKRAARLALLARVRAAVHSVADFSKIEG